MKKRFWLVFFLFTLFPLLLSTCTLPPKSTPATTAQTNDSSHQLEVTDVLGRQVTLPHPAKRVVAIGPGALRMYVYAANLDHVVGVEQVETADISNKPYMLANPDLASLPIIGQGGPNNAPDPEKILTVLPDVIFSTYATDVSSADQLQSQTGIPVVVVSYGGFGVTSIFGELIQDSLMIIGQVMGDTSRAEKAISFIQQAQDDLKNRTQNIAEDEKPTVYIGALGAQGTHGIESTQGQYALLDSINAKNIVDETGRSGALMIDKEKLLEWDPDYIFIDLGGYATVLEDYAKNPTFYEALSAVQDGRVYSQLPYNYYSTNIDTAIADAYFLGKIIYPDAFSDIDPAQKADEIYLALLNQALYVHMAEKYGGFVNLNLGQ